MTAVDPADPLLAGVTLPFTSKMELNLVRPLSPGAHAFLTGTIEGQAPEPVAWMFQHYGGGKTFSRRWGIRRISRTRRSSGCS